jgi:hypothetical protein
MRDIECPERNFSRTVLHCSFVITSRLQSARDLLLLPYQESLGRLPRSLP